MRWIKAAGILFFVLLACGNDDELYRSYLQRELFAGRKTESKPVLGNWPAGSGPTAGRIERAHGFSEGLAAVQINSLWGYIDTTGSLTIPARYCLARDFMGGTAVVGDVNGCGLIDRRGEYLIPPIAKGMTDFVEGVGFMAFAGRLYMVDLHRQTVKVPQGKPDNAMIFSEELAGVAKGGRWGFVGREGRLEIPFRFDVVGRFCEGLSAVKLNGKWGYIDRTGRISIEIRFFDAGDFSEGVAAVLIDSKDRNEQCIFINKDGERIYNRHFFTAGLMSEGVMPVALEKKSNNDSLELKWAYWKPREDSFITDFMLDYAYHWLCP